MTAATTAGADKLKGAELNNNSDALQAQKICQELLAGCGEYRFGVKLHALHLHLSVAESHDQSIGRGGGNFEAVG